MATGAVVVVCFLIRRHYATVSQKLQQLYQELSHTPRLTTEKGTEPSPADPVAAVLVSAYSGLGIPACHRLAIGTDAVEGAEDLCLKVAQEFPRVTFFAGRVLFERERWYQNILHNETAFAVQRRLQWAGKTVVVIPARVT